MKIANTMGGAVVLLALTSGTSLVAQEDAGSADMNFEVPEVRTGYSIGVNIGLNLASQGILSDSVDSDALIRGIADAIADNIALSDEEIVAALEQYSVDQQQRAQAQIEEQRQAGLDFLAENSLEPGVTTTPSGLQYEVIEEGEEGAPSPAADDTVTVHYHGTLTDGTVFDSSVERGEPISFPLDGVIPGWTEGLQLMSVGDTYRFYIPSELAYGAQGAGPIGPYEPLIFEVELLGIGEEGAAAGQ